MQAEEFLKSIRNLQMSQQRQPSLHEAFIISHSLVEWLQSFKSFIDLHIYLSVPGCLLTGLFECVFNSVVHLIELFFFQALQSLVLQLNVDLEPHYLGR